MFAGVQLSIRPFTQYLAGAGPDRTSACKTATVTPHISNGTGMQKGGYSGGVVTREVMGSLFVGCGGKTTVGIGTGAAVTADGSGAVVRDSDRAAAATAAAGVDAVAVADAACADARAGPVCAAPGPEMATC